MYTIGHSTLPIDTFIGALKGNGCGLLIDVRSIPRSRYNPQFEQDALFASLESANIPCVWRKGLGGLRHSVKKDSVNGAWRNASFQSYADYMQTPEFFENMKWLMYVVTDLPTTVIMCAEAVPWRCHRSLIGDAVLARGGTVEDISVSPKGKTARKPHVLTSFARVDGELVFLDNDWQVLVGITASYLVDRL